MAGNPQEHALIRLKDAEECVRLNLLQFELGFNALASTIRDIAFQAGLLRRKRNFINLPGKWGLGQIAMDELLAAEARNRREAFMKLFKAALDTTHQDLVNCLSRKALDQSLPRRKCVKYRLPPTKGVHA